MEDDASNSGDNPKNDNNKNHPRNKPRFGSGSRSCGSSLAINCNRTATGGSRFWDSEPNSNIGNHEENVDYKLAPEVATESFNSGRVILTRAAEIESESMISNAFSVVVVPLVVVVVTLVVVVVVSLVVVALMLLLLDRLLWGIIPIGWLARVGRIFELD